MDSYYGRAIRFEAAIPNKKGRIPSLTGVHLQSSLPIEATRRLDDGSISIGALKENDIPRWIESITGNTKGTIYLPAATEPANDRTLSRFIGKVALEVLASKCIEIEGWNDELFAQPALDEIRQYVRFNKPPTLWPIYIRRIYPNSTIFTENECSFEVLNEWTILITKDQEYFAVIAIFGIEYTINLAGPELDGYLTWLQENDNKSPLYWNDETSREPTTKAHQFK